MSPDEPKQLVIENNLFKFFNVVDRTTGAILGTVVLVGLPIDAATEKAQALAEELAKHGQTFDTIYLSTQQVASALKQSGTGTGTLEGFISRIETEKLRAGMSRELDKPLATRTGMIAIGMAADLQNEIADQLQNAVFSLTLQAGGLGLAAASELKVVKSAQGYVVKVITKSKEVTIDIAKGTVEKIKGLVKTEADDAKVLQYLQQSANHALQIIQETCFAAGTPLLIPGGTKPIEAFRVGDAILSRPEDQPEHPARTSVVEARFELSAQIVELHIAGQVIATTAEHPLFVLGRGWLPIRLLQPRDSVIGASGAATRVERVVFTERVTKVYNLRVAQDHTYFVGGCDWGFSLCGTQYLLSLLCQWAV